MGDIKIKEAPKNAKYVSEFMDTLPVGILNKVNTGCGATSLMLENEENAIICCPTQQLIKNKTAQYPNEKCRYRVLGVMEGVSRRDVREYIEDCREGQPVKILVTYNSFNKIKDILGADIQGYKVIVDEFQEILDGAIYRDKTMLDFLTLLQDIRQVTYLSATPTPTEFLPDELKEVQQHQIDWGENQEFIIPNRIVTDSPFAYVARMIAEHKAGNPFKVGNQAVEEYFFFVNSVTAIYSIIKQTGLKNKDVNIICAENEKNRTKLDDFEVGKIPLKTEHNKTFTFCTKTAFFGVDIFSKAGLIVIVSDGRYRSTMLDMSTDIRQIAGRIRNEDNLFRNIILHVYNTGFITDKENFEYELAEQINLAQRDIDAFECLFSNGEGLEDSLIEKVKNDGTDTLVMYDEQKHKMLINELKIKYYHWKYQTIDEAYRNGVSMIEFYKKAGYSIEQAFEWEQQLKSYVMRIDKTPAFKVLYEEFLTVMNNKPDGFALIPERAKEIESINGLVPLAYQYLSPVDVRKLRYNPTDVKRMIHRKMPETQRAVKHLIRENFIEGESYTNCACKEKLQGIFDKLHIAGKAKATDLKEYCEVEVKKVKTEHGRKDGYIISKLNFIWSKIRCLGN